MGSRVCALTIVIVMIISCTAGKPHRRRQSMTPTCTSYKQFMNKTSGECQDCALCSAGSGVIQSCKEFGDYSDTVCEPCLAGSTYSTRRSHFGAPCYACTRCGGRAVIEECTPTSDTVCGTCPLGTYWDETWGQCRSCSFCFGDVSTRGQYTTRDCMKQEIPTTHWCVHLTSPPYQPPSLYTYRMPNGSVVFYTDLDEDIPDLGALETDKDALAYEEFLEFTAITDPGADGDSSITDVDDEDDFSITDVDDEDDSSITDLDDDVNDDDYSYSTDSRWLDEVVEDADVDFTTETLDESVQDDGFIFGSMSDKLIALICLSVMLMCAMTALGACAINRYKRGVPASGKYKPLSKHLVSRGDPKCNRQDDEPPTW